MKTSLKNQNMKTILVSSLMAGFLCLTAQAGLYPYTSTDAGAIPQGGATFSSEIIVSDITLPNPYVTSVNLVLTFNSTASLGYTAGNSTIQGLLNLGTSPSSPYVNFTPVISSMSGGQATYNVTFATELDGYNPNATWGLVLWDTSNSGIQNGLAGWSLEVTAVPEPVNVALGVFGSLLVLIVGVRGYRSSRKAKAASPAGTA